MQKKISTRALAQGAMIAAIYVVLTKLFEPISFGKTNAVQCRVSELLTILPAFTPAAIPGLFVGCFVGNLRFSRPLALICFEGSTRWLCSPQYCSTDLSWADTCRRFTVCRCRFGCQCCSQPRGRSSPAV